MAGVETLGNWVPRLARDSGQPPAPNASAGWSRRDAARPRADGGSAAAGAGRSPWRHRDAHRLGIQSTSGRLACAPCRSPGDGVHPLEAGPARPGSVRLQLKSWKWARSGSPAWAGASRRRPAVAGECRKGPTGSDLLQHDIRLHSMLQSSPASAFWCVAAVSATVSVACVFCFFCLYGLLNLIHAWPYLKLNPSSNLPPSLALIFVKWASALLPTPGA